MSLAAPSRLTLRGLKEQRATVYLIASVLTGLGLLWLLWLDPLMAENEELSQKIAKTASKVEVAGRKIDKSQGLEAELESLRQELEHGDGNAAGLIKGKDAFQIAGRLGERLSSLSKDELSVKSYQVASSKEHKGYKEASISYSLSATIQGLQALLDELDTVRQLVHVHELDVRKLNNRKGNELDVRLVLTTIIETPDTL